MDFSLTEEQELIVKTTRAFVEQELYPHEKEVEDTGVLRLELLKELKQKAIDAGLYAANMPTEVGGGGLDTVSWVLYEKELSRANYALHYCCVGRPSNILLACQGAQRERYLLPAVRGERTDCLAMTEPGAGSDLQGTRTRAVRQGERYVINGSKTFITNGQRADLIVVVAKTDPKEGAKGVSLIVVEAADAPGFRRGRRLKKLGYDEADTSELFFDDVSLPTENLLGLEEGQGFKQLMKELPQERMIVAYHAVAMMERAVALTIDYVRQREAFGKKIIEFQNTQFELAACKTEATVAKVFCDECIQRGLKGKLDNATAAMAKYWASDALGKVADRCLQLFGGYGYMDEYPISRIYRDARVMRIYAGTNEIMKLVIARSL